MARKIGMKSGGETTARIKCATKGCRNYVTLPATLCKKCRTQNDSGVPSIPSPEPKTPEAGAISIPLPEDDPRPGSMVARVLERMAKPLFTSPELEKPTRQQLRAAKRKTDLATVNRTLHNIPRAERRSLVMA